MENPGMFKELIESSDNIIILTDEEYNIRYSSNAFTKRLGINTANLRGKNLLKVVPEEAQEEIIRLPKGQSPSIISEIPFASARGEKLYFDLHVSNLLNNPEVRGVLFLMHDVTQRKAREMDLIKSNQQLDQVIYKTTHDLRAPLMSALGLVALAEKSDESEQKKYIGLIKKTLLKLDGFIEEMNDFFRNEKLAIQRDKVNLRELLTDSINDLKNLPQSQRVAIDFEVRGEMVLYTDQIRLKTIVANVLSNAIKYSDPKKNEPFIRISVFINEDFCEIRVSDNGIGIEPGVKERIFDLFFRGTTQSQGTGLGLFIVKDTIQKLRGTIKVESVLNEGTTFQIRIPNQISQPVEVE